MGSKELNFKIFEFTTLDEGLEKLKQAVKLRNSMGGALYWNILNDDCITIAFRLRSMGVAEDALASAMGC